MASVQYDPVRDEFLVRIARSFEVDPRGLAEEIREQIKEQLAKEYLAKYRNGILGAINADDIAYKLSDAIAALVSRKLSEGTNEPA